MKTAKHNFPAFIKSSVVSLVLLGTSSAMADVQFRVTYETASSEYVVYMKPDSVPSPDLPLSAQVTLIVPHATGAARFDAADIRSAITGLGWAKHSRVDAPLENSQADYLSFGFYYTGSVPPAFGWNVGKEQRIFSFRSPSGCSSKVALLENFDPFNQLPNSVNTNPGNDFMNAGWLQGYTGNYGDAIKCPVTLGGTVSVPLSGKGSNSSDTSRSGNNGLVKKCEPTSPVRIQIGEKIKKLEILLSKYQGKNKASLEKLLTIMKTNMEACKAA